MDRISLQNMRFFGYHGCYQIEKEVGQQFEVDIDLFLNLDRSANSDRLEDTVNYATLFNNVKLAVETEKYNLLERLAGRIADIAFLDTRVKSVDVRVRKPGVALGGVLDTVEVAISRKNQ